MSPTYKGKLYTNMLSYKREWMALRALGGGRGLCSVWTGRAPLSESDSTAKQGLQTQAVPGVHCEIGHETLQPVV